MPDGVVGLQKEHHDSGKKTRSGQLCQPVKAYFGSTHCCVKLNRLILIRYCVIFVILCLHLCVTKFGQ